jgi:phosphohistidine phosphatase
MLKGTTMMLKRRLIIMRHAEAVPEGTVSDPNRDLTAVGRTQAFDKGEKLRNLGAIPQLVLTSDAKRAMETTYQVLKGAEAAREVGVVPIRGFYNNGYEPFIHEVGSLTDEHGTVLVVAHNPWISDMVSILTGSPCALAPAEMVILTMESESWSDAVTSNGCWRPD